MTPAATTSGKPHGLSWAPALARTSAELRSSQSNTRQPPRGREARLRSGMFAKR